MKDKYEYHKQNEYPGERIAERKRVEEREALANKKADARVAEKGRANEKLMASQKERSTSRAQRVERNTNTTFTVGVVLIVGLFALLLVMGTYSVLNSRKQNDEIETLNAQLYQANYANVILSDENARLNGFTDTIIPVVLSEVYPSNNEINVDANAKIIVVFSEDMDPSTINTNTVIVRQRLTPESGSYNSQVISGIVTYNNRIATFTPIDGLHANQVYGDVFTVTITTGVKDLEGNRLKSNYVWSFTTSRYSFNTGITTSQTN